MVHEALEDCKLLLCERQYFTAHCHLAGSSVQPDAADVDDRRALRQMPADQSSNPGHIFRKRERFNEIVVGPRLQAAYAIVDSVTCRQDDHRAVDLPAPK